ncbi:MAG: hypothetical protein ACRDFX_02930 [Chloroflexota bacterium]
MKVWTALQVLTTVVVAVAAPMAAYILLGNAGWDIAGSLIFVVLGAVALNAILLALQAVFTGLPVREPPAPRSAYPAATAVVVAGEPADSQAVRSTIRALLDKVYIAPPSVIVIYLREEQVRGVLEEVPDAVLVPAMQLAPEDALRAALESVQGAFLGIFDAGLRPHPQSFTRAWLWLSNECAVVQGRIIANNASQSWTGRVAAVSMESSPPMALAAARSGVGARVSAGNTYLRTSAMASLLADDASGPAGKPIQYVMQDRHLLAHGPVPAGFGQVFRAARSGALGRLAVLPFPSRGSWRTCTLQRGRRLSAFLAFFWRGAYVWVAIQTLPLTAYRIWRHDGLTLGAWLAPLAVLIALYLLAEPLVTTIGGYALSGRETRRHRWWFVLHFLTSILFYRGLLGTADRAAQIRLLLGTRAGGGPRRRAASPAERVAPGKENAPARSDAPAPGASPMDGDYGHFGPVAGDLEAATSSESLETLPPDEAEPATMIREVETNPQRIRPQELPGHARYFAGLVQALAAEIDSGDRELQALCKRIDGLDRCRRAVTQLERERDLAGHSNTDLYALHDLLAHLVDDPSRIALLGALPQYSALLSDVTQHYACLLGVATAVRTDPEHDSA